MTVCEPCAYASEHGYWGASVPKGWTHCRDCHVSWPGGNVWGHCSGCCTTFRGLRTFDDHHSAALCAPRPSLTASEWTYRSVTYRRLRFDATPGFHFDYYGQTGEST